MIKITTKFCLLIVIVNLLGFVSGSLQNNSPVKDITSNLTNILNENAHTGKVFSEIFNTLTSYVNKFNTKLQEDTLKRELERKGLTPNFNDQVYQDSYSYSYSSSEWWSSSSSSDSSDYWWWWDDVPEQMAKQNSKEKSYLTGTPSFNVGNLMKSARKYLNNEPSQKQLEMSKIFTNMSRSMSKVPEKGFSKYFTNDVPFDKSPPEIRDQSQKPVNLSTVFARRQLNKYGIDNVKVDDIPKTENGFNIISTILSAFYNAIDVLIGYFLNDQSKNQALSINSTLSKTLPDMKTFARRYLDKYGMNKGELVTSPQNIEDPSKILLNNSSNIGPLSNKKFARRNFNKFDKSSNYPDLISTGKRKMVG